jgi:hypothetical protein
LCFNEENKAKFLFKSHQEPLCISFSTNRLPHVHALLRKTGLYGSIPCQWRYPPQNPHFSLSAYFRAYARVKLYALYDQPQNDLKKPTMGGIKTPRLLCVARIINKTPFGGKTK